MGSLWTQLLLQFVTDLFETLQVFLSWSEDVRVIRGLYTCFFLISLHYENTPIQIYRKFYLQKPELFR